MNLIKTFTLCLLSVILLAGACASEDEIGQEELTGTWEVTSAERNGKQTETVVGATFTFGEDGKLRTNILNGRELTGTYRLSGDDIVHDLENGEKMMYEAKRQETGGLELKTRIQGYDFRLMLSEMHEQ